MTEEQQFGSLIESENAV